MQIVENRVLVVSTKQPHLITEAITKSKVIGRDKDDYEVAVHWGLQEAQALTSLGDRPLVVVTAQLEASDGWMPAQDDLASLSTNSAHRVLAEATHASLTENQSIAAQSSQAVRDVVNSVRTGTPLAG